MKVLWATAPLTAGEICQALQLEDPAWHPKTAQTLIGRLVKKGAVGFTTRGRAHFYQPLCTAEECATQASESFLERVFGGSLQPMLAHFVEQRKLSAKDIRELKKILEGGKVSASLAGGLTQVARLSWQASLLVALVLLVQLLIGRRIPARWRYNLWLLVVARLVLPSSLPSPLSLYNAVDWGTHRVRAALQPAAPPAIATPRPAVAPVAADPTSPPPETSVVPVREEARLAPPLPATEPGPAPLPTLLPGPPGQPRFPWLRLLSRVWLGGMVLLSAQVLLASWRLHRRLRAAVPLGDPALLALLAECRALMGVRFPVPAFATRALGTPAVFGFLRPRLLLPEGLAARFSTQELRHIFLHELAHVRRRDLPMNWLLTALRIVHWFNPVLWHGLRRMCADRELACDALAMERDRGHAPAEYGRTILRLLESAARPAVAPGLMGILESRAQMVRRIRLIAQFRGRQRWSWLALAATVALGVAGLTDAVQRAGAQVAGTLAPGKTLRVTVLDARSGQPLPGVTLWSPFGPGVEVLGPTPTTTTDAHGNAALPVANLQFGFLATHPDYAPAGWAQTLSSDKAPLPDEATLRLERGEPIGGVVHDEGGRPLAGVAVEIETVADHARKPGAPEFLQYPAYSTRYLPAAVTDGAGRWSCPHFAPGVLTLALTFRRAGGGCSRVHAPYPMSYAAPGGEIRPGLLDEVRQQALTVTLPEGITLRGVVRSAAGAPLPGIEVTERDRRSPAPISVSKTGADGRFTLLHRDPHQILLTLTGEGMATLVRLVSLAPGLPEQELTLRPATPLRLRVVDDRGAPIAGASIAPAELDVRWTSQTLQTDAQGRAAWQEAPLEPQVYLITAPNYRARALPLSPAAEEIAIALRSTGLDGTAVTLHPTGEEGKPLATFTVLASYRQDGNPQFEPLAEGCEGLCTTIVPAEKSQLQEFRLKVTSPGLAPWISERLYDSAGDVTLSPSLRAVRPLRGRVLLPDGAPAAQASVILTQTEGERSFIDVNVSSRHRFRVDTRHAIPVRTPADGSYALPVSAPEAAVLFIHEGGFLATTAGRLLEMPEVRLTPFGTVEGQFTLRGQPRAGQRIFLRPRATPAPYYLWFSLSETTDADGRFRFSPAPLGACLMYADSPSHGEVAQGWQTLVQVKSGEVTHADLTGRGRPVTGRVRVSPAEGELDWDTNLYTALLADAARPATVYPDYTDFVRQQDYLRAIRSIPEVDDGPHPSYPLVFEPDGSFTAEAVPPGKYRLRLTAKAREKDGRNFAMEELGALDEPVTLPEGDEKVPVALGSFTLVLNERLAARRPPPLQLQARTLAGEPVSLADYAGKNVLLLFWASWAPPTAETLSLWKQLHEAHGTDPRFVMLGVTLDDDAAAAKSFAETHAWSWPQAQLTGRGKAEITEALQVNELPAALLVGPDGRLLSRQPASERLRRTVDSVLTSAR